METLFFSNINEGFSYSGLHNSLLGDYKFFPYTLGTKLF